MAPRSNCLVVRRRRLPIALGCGDGTGREARPDQPVTRVSWFAARAYCEAAGARLPTWYEWEFAAAADEHRPDARSDPDWREKILDWYGQPAGGSWPTSA